MAKRLKLIKYVRFLSTLVKKYAKSLMLSCSRININNCAGNGLANKV